MIMPVRSAAFPRKWGFRLSMRDAVLACRGVTPPRDDDFLLLLLLLLLGLPKLLSSIAWDIMKTNPSALASATTMEG